MSHLDFPEGFCCKYKTNVCGICKVYDVNITLNHQISHYVHSINELSMTYSMNDDTKITYIRCMHTSIFAVYIHIHMFICINPYIYLFYVRVISYVVIPSMLSK